MKTKLSTLQDVVRRISSGSSVAIGGSLFRRQPNAVVREIIRQGIKNLTVFSWAATTSVDMLAAADAIRRWEGIYVGFFRFGLAPNFRRSVEKGRIEACDLPESAAVARFRAAGMGVSFLPVKGLFGTDMVRLNTDQFREITCPFSGETYHAVPAAQADFTILHGYWGDIYGNIQWPVMRDSDDIDPLMAKAARHLIVTVERIIPHEKVQKQPTMTYIPHRCVKAVVELPYGAHPCACDGIYDEDEVALAEYLENSKSERTSQSYFNRTIFNCRDHEAYLELFGGTGNLSRLRVDGQHRL